MPIIYAFTLVAAAGGGVLPRRRPARRRRRPFPLLNVLAGLIVVRFGLALLFHHRGLGVNWIYA
ncbi:MAG: hypothetical protein IPF57_24785, partial [Gammaproteobacteria bacterium]|nr:hypothetical protein [Gammaproteobacteria bacterium]